MFKTETVPNPNYRGQMHVARLVRVDVCACGSRCVSRYSRFDREGGRDIRLVCNDCGKSESM